MRDMILLHQAFSKPNLSYLLRLYGAFYILFSCLGTLISVFLLVSGDQGLNGKDPPSSSHQHAA